MRSSWRMRLGALFAALAMPTMARASIILDFSSQGAIIQAKSSMGFKNGPLALPSDLVRRNDRHVADGLIDEANAGAPRFDAPAGLDDRDYVLGRMITGVKFAGGRDIFNFAYKGHASAVVAETSDNEPADAFVHLMGRISFTLDSSLAVPDGTLLGQFVFRPLPRPESSSMEKVSGRLYVGPSAIKIPRRGPALRVDAIAGQTYTVEVRYNMDVRHGADPTAAYRYTTALVTVPEPGACAPALLGAFVLLRRARRLSASSS